MNFKFCVLLLVVALLAINQSDAWGRRRRRGGGWFRKTVKSVGRVVKKGYNFYKKHKQTIHTVGKVAWGLLGGDVGALENMATLKTQDQESYGEFMDNLKENLEENYPEEDIEETLHMLNEIADMSADDRSELVEAIKEEMDNLEISSPVADHIREELSMRVANLA